MKIRENLMENQRCDFCEKKNKPLFMTDKSDGDLDRDICLTCAEHVLNISKSTSILNRLTTMFSAIAKRLLDQDTKKLLQAGMLNTDLTLTAKGEEHLMSIMLEKNKVEFVQTAEEIIAEQKDERK